MRFFRIPLVAATVVAEAVDPRATPGAVPSKFVVDFGLLNRGDGSATRLLMTLEGTAGNTASFEIWAQEDGQVAAAEAPPTAFYRLNPAAVQVVTVAAIVSATGVIPADGKVYFRCTVAPAADAALKVQLV